MWILAVEVRTFYIQGGLSTWVSKRVTLLKVVIHPLLARLTCKLLQIGTDMLLIIASTDDELFTNVNIDDLE